MVKSKRFWCFLVCFVWSALLFSACRNEGVFVNKTQPWYEGNVYHNTPHCGVHPYTDYITIMYDDDEGETHTYTSSSRTNLSVYQSRAYRDRGYRYTAAKYTKVKNKYVRTSSAYMTIPVQKNRYECYYS